MKRGFHTDEPPVRRLTLNALRREDGTTLVELLVGSVVGLIVLAASLLVLDDSVKLARVTDQRIDATQRGREAMETVTRELRSQVCLGVAPALTEATNTSVSFYVNLAGIDAVPQRHKISLESGELILRRYVPTGTPPALTFPATPTSTRVLLQNAQQVGSTPIFRYYRWTAGAFVAPSTLVTTPLDATTFTLPVKVAISFRANPSAEFGNQRGFADLHDSIYVRSSDPSDPARGPRCN